MDDALNLPRVNLRDSRSGFKDAPEFRCAAQAAIDLRKMQSQRSQPASAANSLSRQERETFSIRAGILAALTGNWDTPAAGLVREFSGYIEKLTGLMPSATRENASFFVPTGLTYQVPGAPLSRFLRHPDLQARAAYAVGGPTTGGNLVETELLAADFISVLRNASVTAQLGARYLTGLVGKIAIPRQNAQTTTYWVGESSAITEGEATFDQVQLSPKTVGSLSKMSRLTLMQTTPAIEMLVRDDLTTVNALAIDSAAILGTGSSAQPTGIVNQSGVGVVVGGTNGAPASFDLMTALFSAPAIANAPQESLGFAINAKTKGFLATQKSSTGQYLWQPQQSPANGLPSDMIGTRYAVSNVLPSNLTKGTSSGVCSMAVFGDRQELLIGEWGVTEILVNPFDSTGFTTGDVWIRALQTIDIGVRHAASFAVVSDLLTTGF